MSAIFCMGYVGASFLLQLAQGPPGRVRVVIDNNMNWLRQLTETPGDSDPLAWVRQYFDAYGRTRFTDFPSAGMRDALFIHGRDRAGFSRSPDNWFQVEQLPPAMDPFGMIQHRRLPLTVAPLDPKPVYPLLESNISDFNRH